MPLTGHFAGLKRALGNGIGKGDSADQIKALRGHADTWMAEAVKLENDMPTLSLEQQIGQGMVLEGVNPSELVKKWDTGQRGQVLRAEFRTRFKALMEILRLIYPGMKAIDELFDKYDQSGDGVIEHKELLATLEALLEQGIKVRAEWGPILMEAMAKAAELRQRAEWANSAAEAVEAADKIESELVDLRASIDAQLDAQLGLVLVRRQIKAVRLKLPAPSQEASYSLPAAAVLTAASLSHPPPLTATLVLASPSLRATWWSSLLRRAASATTTSSPSPTSAPCSRRST